MGQEKKTVVIAFAHECTDLLIASVDNINKVALDLNKPESIRKAKDKINEGYVDSLLVVLGDDITQKPIFSEIILLAVEKKSQVILIHPDGVPFPSPSKLSHLDPKVKHVFDSIAISYLPEYVDACWDTIKDKIFDTRQPLTEYSWFLSHKQSSGQSIVLPLYLELAGLGETAFLDIRAQFDLHHLETLVEKAKIFLFLLTDGIFQSEYCHKELSQAVSCRLPIVILREQKYTVTEIPPIWLVFKNMLTGPRTIVYSSKFLPQCASKLRDIRVNPQKNGTEYYKPSDADYYPTVEDLKKNNATTSATSESGPRYYGDMVNGQKHGSGYEVWANGDEYRGEYKNGLLHGTGVYIYKSNGDKYEGQFNNGIISGHGKYLYTNGGSYTGQWANAARNGSGTEIWSDGAKYVGNYKDNVMDGKGTYYYVNGEVYEGNFQKGDKSGYGVYKYPNGGRYEGNWQQGKRWGKGKEFWSSGDVYEGEYKEGTMHGHGVYKFANGCIYDGEFVNGIMEGKGRYTYTTKGYFDGYWKGGKKVKGIDMYPSGAYYEGEYVDGFRSGKGTANMTNGTKWTGTWANDAPSGVGILTNAAGKKSETTFNENDFK